MPKVPCKNCGDRTNLEIATGPRASMGYCVPCFRQVDKALVDREGNISRWPDEARVLSKRTPWDARG